MKRFWIGIFILSLLLAGSILIHTTLEKIVFPISSDLDLACKAALSEDWASAQDLAQHAWVRWETFHHLIAAFADHSPMDEVDGLFRELNIYAATRENPHFSATCTHLRFMTSAIAESHRLSWWNLL